MNPRVAGLKLKEPQLKGGLKLGLMGFERFTEVIFVTLNPSGKP
jgi:hypothetical protein